MCRKNITSWNLYIRLHSQHTEDFSVPSIFREPMNCWRKKERSLFVGVIYKPRKYLLIFFVLKNARFELNSFFFNVILQIELKYFSQSGYIFLFNFKYLKRFLEPTKISIKNWKTCAESNDFTFFVPIQLYLASSPSSVLVLTALTSFWFYAHCLFSQ